MKENKQFMILSALGIIFVLDDHAGGQLKIFSNLFPYNSYYMPMFVFISGYFFKPEKIENLFFYIKKKTKSVLYPYYLYNGIFWIITIALCYCFPLNWSGGTENIMSLIKTSWTWGTPVDLTSPGWFVMMLFAVVITYAIIRKIFNNAWNEYISLIIFIFINMLAVYLSYHHLFDDNIVLLIKVMFFVSYYHLGYCYKIKISGWIHRIPSIVILLSAGLINIVAMLVFNNNITFNSCAFMQSFLSSTYFLPFLTSMTGIAFWLTIAKLLVPLWGTNQIVNFISDHTFYIMMTHLFFYNILNLLFALFEYKNFDISAFTQSAWYNYLPIPQIGLIYILFALLGAWGGIKLKNLYLSRFFPDRYSIKP